MRRIKLLTVHSTSTKKFSFLIFSLKKLIKKIQKKKYLYVTSDVEVNHSFIWTLILNTYPQFCRLSNSPPILPKKLKDRKNPLNSLSPKKSQHFSYFYLIIFFLNQKLRASRTLQVSCLFIRFTQKWNALHLALRVNLHDLIIYFFKLFFLLISDNV